MVQLSGSISKAAAEPPHSKKGEAALIYWGGDGAALGDGYGSRSGVSVPLLQNLHTTRER